MSWIFDILQVAMALCAIPIYKELNRNPFWHEKGLDHFSHAAVVVFVMFMNAMTLDFLGSLPGLGVGTKSAFGQGVLEPVSHLAVTGALVLGLWRNRRIDGLLVGFMIFLGLIGFVCSTFVDDGTLVRELANGLMPAYYWLVTAICVVLVTTAAWPRPSDQFGALLLVGLAAVAAAAAQHELIVQWAQGNAHYPVLK